MPGASIRILVPVPATDLTCWEAGFPCIGWNFGLCCSRARNWLFSM
jgi:hypothetical protein